MSVRAYKIEEIKRADSPTFNVGYDNKIVDLASQNGLTDGGGMLGYEKEDIEDALKNWKVNKLQKEILEQMLKDCGDDNYVEYFCF